MFGFAEKAAVEGPSYPEEFGPGESLNARFAPSFQTFSGAPWFSKSERAHRRRDAHQRLPDQPGTSRQETGQISPFSMLAIARRVRIVAAAQCVLAPDPAIAAVH